MQGEIVMEKERRKILLNTLMFLAMACLFVGLIIAYGKYNFCLKGETTEKGYSIGLVMFFFVIVASYPMFFTFIRRDLKEKMSKLSWLVIHSSIFSSSLVFLGIAFCRSIFEPEIYNVSGFVVHSDNGIGFWTLLLLQAALSLILLVISLYQSFQMKKNNPEVGREVVSLLRMNRNSVGYLATNEIGFLMLVLIFYIISASYFGECIIFRGVESPATNATGTMLYIIADRLESLAELLICVVPILSFVILKKQEQQEVMRIVPQIAAAISGVILAIMLYYVAIYNTKLYNGDYELVKNSSGQVVTIAGLLVVPIIITIGLLALSLWKIYEQRKK